MFKSVEDFIEEYNVIAKKHNYIVTKEMKIELNSLILKIQKKIKNLHKFPFELTLELN